ncbi:MAG: type II toxin-antitoxin system VapC family toxin [Rhodocyclaceae bacterium]|nr:type II toxin-antitoxin system VapC family toxin [Rhodocyclaceae bacterium]
MTLVLDASFALAWLYERADSAEAELAERGLSLLCQSEVWVPWLWHAEVGSALLVGERRRVVSEAHGAAFMARLADLPIKTDTALPQSRLDTVMGLARQHGLSGYDAFYLELALRHEAVLATFDAALSQAMERCGGTVLH